VSVSSDPNYRSLASTALAAMGVPSSGSMVAAVVSQWQCELGADAWPPRRNNPGNVAKGWADGVGIPYTVEFPNPQPGNPIVTFGSPTDGARAYGIGIRSFSRYSSALAYARGGDGARFLKAITSAGYGTSYTCSLAIFTSLHGSAITPGATTTGSLAPPASSTSTSTSIDPGIVLASYAPNHLLTQADLDLLYNQAKASYAQGNPLAEWQWDNMPELGPAFRQKLQAYLGKPVSSLPNSFDLGPLNPLDAIGQVAAAIGSIPAALGNVLAHLAELAFVLVLIVLGLYIVARGED